MRQTEQADGSGQSGEAPEPLALILRRERSEPRRTRARRKPRDEGFPRPSRASWRPPQDEESLHPIALPLPAVLVDIGESIAGAWLRQDDARRRWVVLDLGA